MLGMMLFGYLCFRGMGISQMPDVDFPILSISVSWEGASPEVMEIDVVDVVEDAMMGIEGLRDISSSSRHGSASITLEFELERDIDAALQEAQSKLSEVQRRLPEDIDPPVIRKSNPEDQPIMWVGVSGDRPLSELMQFIDRQVEDRFKTVPGVGEVFLGGYTEPNLRVWIDPKKLAAYELTVDDIVNSIQTEHLEIPAGQLETKKKESNVRVMGEVRTVEDFRNITINFRGGQPMYKSIPLQAVASIEDGMADVRRISRVNGKTSVGLGIRKQRGANTVKVAHEVKQRVRELQETLPKDMAIGINFDSTRFIEDAVNELIFTMILSAALTSLVCWLFLGSWSSTVNILLAIPTSLLGAFICLKFAGFTLNTFTLLGLTLAIGIVVDDAIMVLENIVRHREMGESQHDAALNGAQQIYMAALVATTALVAIFLPVVFMKGIIGKFFLQFGITISVAVMLSLLEAVTFAPMRCSQFLEISKRKTHFGRWFESSVKYSGQVYERVLRFVLVRKKKVIVLAFLFFLATLTLIPRIRREFVPVQDQSMFMARLKTPIGSSIEFTNERFKNAEEIVSQYPEIERYFAAVGGFGGGGANQGVIFITLKQPKDRPRDPKTHRRLTQQEIMARARKDLNAVPDLKAVLQDLSTRGFAAQRGFPIEFTVRGPDWEKLVTYAEQIQTEMKKSDLFQDVDTDYIEGMPEVRIYPDRDAATSRGVSVNAIARTINTLIAGERVSKYTRGGRRYDVRVSVRKEGRQTPEDIENLLVRNNRGELVRLSEVIQIKEQLSLLTITRRDRERAFGVFANVGDGKSQADAIALARQIGKRILSEDYRIIFSGSSQTFQESFSSLFFALWLGIVIAYMVLASQFNHVIHPFTVLLALPFSISGALIALWMGNFSLNVFSMIGLLLLMGIVKKNSILLVEFTNQLREEGLPPHEALMKACPIRFRPIMMTSISTIAAAIPPALALGPGAETRIPMAVAVIGGVLVSTILTLIVVPCAYEGLVPLENPVKRRKLLTISFWQTQWDKLMQSALRSKSHS